MARIIVIILVRVNLNISQFIAPIIFQITDVAHKLVFIISELQYAVSPAKALLFSEFLSALGKEATSLLTINPNNSAES